MNESRGNRAIQILAALGKSAVYLLLFLGSQFTVSNIYGIALTLRNSGMTQIQLMQRIYERFAVLILFSHLLTLAVLVIFNLIRGKRLTETLTIRRVPAAGLAPAALVPALYLAVIGVMSLLPERWLDSYTQSASVLEDTSVLAFVATALVAPLTEEIIFRGLIQSRLSRVMPGWAAVLLSSVVFGICHGDPVWMAYAFVLGVIFGFVTLRWGSIVPSILMHIIFNGIGHLTVLLEEYGVNELAFYASILVIAVAACVLARKGIAQLFQGPGRIESVNNEVIS